MATGWKDWTEEAVAQERLHVWLFRRDGTLILTVRQAGDRDGLDLPLRSLARIVAETGATALVMAHNHPSGDPRPSSADVTTTRAVWRMARTLGAVLLDHVIVGRERSFSFRANGLL